MSYSKEFFIFFLFLDNSLDWLWEFIKSLYKSPYQVYIVTDRSILRFCVKNHKTTCWFCFNRIVIFIYCINIWPFKLLHQKNRTPDPQIGPRNLALEQDPWTPTLGQDLRPDTLRQDLFHTDTSLCNRYHH